MYEVEAKVPLSSGALKRVESKLKKVGTRLGDRRKEDRYYANPKKHFLRVRRENDNSVLNLKLKRREKGIEINQELELTLESADGFHRLLRSLGIPCTFRKTKKTRLYRYGGFTVELNHVVGLGDYLEIETVVRSESEAPAAQKRLDRLFGEFGFKRTDYESRYYIDLLTEKRKNR